MISYRCVTVRIQGIPVIMHVWVYVHMLCVGIQGIPVIIHTLFACVHICIYVHMYICIHAAKYEYIHTCTYLCIRIQGNTGDNALFIHLLHESSQLRRFLQQKVFALLNTYIDISEHILWHVRTHSTHLLSGDSFNNKSLPWWTHILRIQVHMT